MKNSHWESALFPAKGRRRHFRSKILRRRRRRRWSEKNRNEKSSKMVQPRPRITIRHADRPGAFALPVKADELKPNRLRAGSRWFFSSCRFSTVRKISTRFGFHFYGEERNCDLSLSFFLSFFSSSFSGSLFVFSLILSLSLSWCSLYHSLYYSLSCFIVFLSLPLSFYLNFHRLSFFPYGLIFQFFLRFSFYLSFSFFYCLETVSKI